MMLTASVVVRLRPDPVIALLWGTGLGMLGAGIITIAKSYVDKGLGALGISDADGKPPAPPPPVSR